MPPRGGGFYGWANIEYGRTRTYDHQIKSPMLYLLSYIPINSSGVESCAGEWMHRDGAGWKGISIPRHQWPLAA